MLRPPRRFRACFSSCVCVVPMSFIRRLKHEYDQGGHDDSTKKLDGIIPSFSRTILNLICGLLLHEVPSANRKKRKPRNCLAQCNISRLFSCETQFLIHPESKINYRALMNFSLYGRFKFRNFSFVFQEKPFEKLRFVIEFQRSFQCVFIPFPLTVINVQNGKPTGM